MSGQSTDNRPAELESFMAELRDLRERAGRPSFRAMASKSGAVSHATLHLTVTGYRLQPWETVREFVRACDGDEHEWKPRWERAHAALAGTPEQPPPPGDEHAEPEPGARSALRRSPVLLVPVAVAVVAGLTFAGVMAFGEEDTRPPDTPGSGTPAAGAVPDEPVYPGDASKFVADVTIPDGTVIKPGEQFVKVWQIENVGTVPWRNRFLQRTDSHSDTDDCRTPPRIPINDTAPRQKVQVTVTVNAPEKRTDCKVYWKMVDENNRKLLPSSRPIYFEVRVRP